MTPAYKLRRRIRERAAFVAAIRARHQAEAVSRDASVGADQAAVCAEGLHAPQCAPAVAGLTPPTLGHVKAGEEGAETAFRNAGVTGRGACA